MHINSFMFSYLALSEEFFVALELLHVRPAWFRKYRCLIDANAGAAISISILLYIAAKLVKSCELVQT